jgi:hypothetical protein
MSYYYQHSQYEDYGNQGNENYEYEYESYLDHAEPDHWEPDHNPSETEYHDYEPDHTDPNPSEPNHNHEYDEHGFVHEVPEYEVTDEAHEPEPDWEAFEQAEMEYADRGGYLEEDTRYEMEADGHHPGVPRHEGEHTYEHGALEHDDNEDARASTLPDRELADMYDKWGYEPPAAFTHPDTHPFTPAPIPHTRHVPDANQQGHVTALEHAQDVRELAHAGYNAREHAHADYVLAEPSPLHSYLDTLRQDCNNGMPSAVAFIQGLQDYSEECRFEQEEWKADEREVIRNNHNITYPKRDTQATPRSWYADGHEYATPSIIEQSFPLGPGLKRRRYRNVRTPRYRTSQPRPPPMPCPPPELDDNIALHTPPSPTTRSNKHHTNNRTPKPPRNVNFDTTPYLTSQGRPPPEPNKTQIRNGHHYGAHTMTGTTPTQRPPPWPIISSPTPILSVNSRPPPWPNQPPHPCCHCRRHCHNTNRPITSTPSARPPPWPIIPGQSNRTSQNHRNAKRRIKAKSRGISDKISI